MRTITSGDHTITLGIGIQWFQINESYGLDIEIQTFFTYNYAEMKLYSYNDRIENYIGNDQDVFEYANDYIPDIMENIAASGIDESEIIDAFVTLASTLASDFDSFIVGAEFFHLP